MMYIKKQGYILPFTLFICMFATMLVYYIYARSMLFTIFERASEHYEKARLHALDGVQIALSMVAYTVNTPPAQSQATQTPIPNTEKEKKVDTHKEFFAYLWPRLNTWQTFTFPGSNVQGTINIYITSEDGKVNLNTVFDFKTHLFQGEKQTIGNWSLFLKGLLNHVEKIAGAKNLWTAFATFMKERTSKLNDVSELLTIPAFAPFKELKAPLPSGAESPEPLVYLYDLFTVDGNKTQLDPRLFTTSMLLGLDMKTLTAAQRQQTLPAMRESFKKWSTWYQDWGKSLAPVYGKDLSKNIDMFLDPVFEPKIFSVISYGTSGTITQSVLAIIERLPLPQKGISRYTATIKKIIWL